jgi:TolA-binding protein
MKRRLPLLFVAVVAISLGATRPAVREYDHKANLLARLEYEHALKLMEEERYDDAIVQFRHYLDYYGDLYYGDEALFLMGKCFENLEQWNEAADAYDLMVKRYTPPFFPLRLILRRPTSPLIPEALYRAGRSLEEMRRYKEAANRYIRIIKGYFHTPFCKEAQERIKAIAKELKDSKWAKKMEKKVEKLVKKMEKK